MIFYFIQLYCNDSEVATVMIMEMFCFCLFFIFISEAPEVFLSAERQRVSVGEQISVACNVSGHPQPELHWINKHNGQTLVRVCGHFSLTLSRYSNNTTFDI